MAENVYSTLLNQESRLSQLRNKMVTVWKNINLASSITLMVRQRTRNDNKLIMWLFLGLFVEIALCLFVIKPIVRG